MKKMRLALVALSVLSLFGLVVMAALSYADASRETESRAWIPALVLTASALLNVYLVHRYASETSRSAVPWAIGAFLFPYIVPVLLAMRPESSGATDAVPAFESVGLQTPGAPAAAGSAPPAPAMGAPGKELFTAFPKSNPVFLHSEGLFGKSTWLLDRLRLCCFMLPGTFKWRVVTSSQEFGSFFPDLMPEETGDALFEFLEGALASANRDAFYGAKVCLAGYDGEGATLDLHKMKKDRAVLIAGLYHFRGERRERLKGYLSGNPNVTLKGWFGRKAVLDRDGFHSGRKSIPWPDVKQISTETVNGMITHMYLLPEGRSGGIFDLRRGKYSLTGIPARRKDLYIAECNFWRTHAGNGGG